MAREFHVGRVCFQMRVSPHSLFSLQLFGTSLGRRLFVEPYSLSFGLRLGQHHEEPFTGRHNVVSPSAERLTDFLQSGEGTGCPKEKAGCVLIETAMSLCES